MDVKEAINWIFDIYHDWENVYGISGEQSLIEGKKKDEVIGLLKRGEKYEDMWREYKTTMATTVELEQKYLECDDV